MNIVNVIGYEGLYEISELGNVFNKKTGKILKQHLWGGYHCVVLRNNGIRKTLSIHRLLAQTFIENPFNKNYVDHIDRNKLNNSLNNLRWVSHLENCQNRSKHPKNTSGETGIYGILVDKKYSYYQAKIMANGKIHTKNFQRSEQGFKDAREWYSSKKLEYHIN